MEDDAGKEQLKGTEMDDLPGNTAGQVVAAGAGCCD